MAIITFLLATINFVIVVPSNLLLEKKFDLKFLFMKVFYEMGERKWYKR
jgi:hypothetical protein